MYVDWRVYSSRMRGTVHLESCTLSFRSNFGGQSLRCTVLATMPRASTSCPAVPARGQRPGGSKASKGDFRILSRLVPFLCLVLAYHKHRTALAILTHLLATGTALWKRFDKDSSISTVDIQQCGGGTRTQHTQQPCLCSESSCKFQNSASISRG